MTPDAAEAPLDALGSKKAGQSGIWMRGPCPLSPTLYCPLTRSDIMAKGNWSHGQSRVSDPYIKKAYRAWAGMRQRCVNPKSHYFHRYGGRGIKVHPAWDAFTLFLQDVGLPPTTDHLLDRMDNNGNYEPGNVKWSTISESNSTKENPGPTPVLRSKHLDEIKKLSSEGLSTRKIAAQLGLGKSYVHRLVYES